MKKDRPDTRKQGWKDIYRQKAYNGYVWGGWLEDEGLHMFQKEYRVDGLPRYTVVKCRDSELFDTNDNGKSSFQLLVDYGMTR